MTRPTVTVYTRKHCELCRQAEAVVAEVAHGLADVEFVDIDLDPALIDRYTVRVPVVAVDGTEVFDYEVEPDALRLALTGITATSAPRPSRWWSRRRG